MALDGHDKEIENLIDLYGLKHVMDAIAHICDEKAEHLLTNWQDKNTAVRWHENASRIYQLTLKLD